MKIFLFFRIGMLIVISLLFTFNSFGQEDSLVENHNPEALWYLQKETWLAGSIFLVIVLIGFFYRASRVKRQVSKTITTEIHTRTEPAEIERDADSV